MTASRSGFFSNFSGLNKQLFSWICVGIILQSCSTTSKTGSSANAVTDLNEINITPKYYQRYQAAETRKLDLLHTKLRVSFDWPNAYLYGKATLTLKPYFYETDQVVLDAKGFEFHQVALVTDTGNVELTYTYESDKITIELNRAYTREEEFKVFMDYTAKPNERETKGSTAITDARGLYFINNKNEDADKPQQIWTQGETESNSAWFPTIDKPNERMTQEIYITVNNRFTTLSNGLLIYSTDNGDSTRTDYWKQDQNHAPYLVMMAIGEYAVVRDQWRDIEVNYYVEKEYEPYAKSIFGSTPEMLQFYSDILGVDYPWSKYSQVVVRDYVSGAMENTTATIYGEFVQRNDRELLDRDYEDYISHELFHHWFGDLVTCESWANLPLNESFATYGEYLWNEYKYGRDEADYGLHNDLMNYIWTSDKKNVDIIRFNYKDKEDMFDSHSYAKGGRVLHMLRKHVGDDAFFASLKLYLNQHKYTSVEIHDLRIAFEEVTGEDLNWFFNQWFLNSGHPHLMIAHQYIDTLHHVVLTISQVQDMDKAPLYRIPLEVDIYAGGKVVRHSITSDSIRQVFVFKSDVKPDLVNVDAEKMLLGVKKDYKPKEEWIFMYRNAPRLLDRMEALSQLKTYENDGEALAVMEEALDDEHWSIREEATGNLKAVANKSGSSVKPKLMELAKNDEKASVRAHALLQLSTYYHPDSVGEKDPTLRTLYEEAMSDQSYKVNGAALMGLADHDFDAVVKIVDDFDEITKEKLRVPLAKIYGHNGTGRHHTFFTDLYPKLDDDERYSFLEYYSTYLVRQDDEIIIEGVKLIEQAVYDDEDWWTRLMTIYRIKAFARMFEEKELAIEVGLGDKDNTEEEIANLNRKKAQIQRHSMTIEETLSRIKSKETNENVIQFWNGVPR